MRSAAPSAARTAASHAILALLVAWAAGNLFVFTSFLWTPRATFGLASNYSGQVTGVAPGSPADKAHIVPGDRIILSQTPFDARPKVIGAVTPVAAGTVVRLRMQHELRSRDVSLTAVPTDDTPADRLSRLCEAVSAAIFIFVGAILIVLRPGPVTWGFGLFGLLCNPVVPALSHFPSAGAHLAYVGLYDVLQNVGVVGLLIFALNFPQPLPVRWRSILTRALPALFIVLATWTLWIDLAVCVFAKPVHSQNVGLQIAFGVVNLLAVALITETYAKGPAENRPRLRWVLVGFYIGLLGNYVGNVLVYTANTSLPPWLDDALIASEVTLPLAVSYAVVRHRVIEIDLFISRALVYAAFTSVLVLIFGVTDWVFDRMLENFRLSIVFDACISIGVAFLFDRVHKSFESTVSHVVFRSRHVAHDRLRRAAKTFRYVADPSSLDQALVAEPRDALDIASMAFFRRDGSVYRLVANAGWPPDGCTLLSHDDRLVLEHLAKDGPLFLAEIPWTCADLQPKPDRPVVSVPLRSATELIGLLLCSHKRNGEGLDPEELRQLIAFVDAAAIGYARLESEKLRHRAEDLQLQVSLLNARLDEAHRESASPLPDANITAPF